MQKIQFSIIALIGCSSLLFSEGGVLPPIEKEVKKKEVTPQIVESKSDGYSISFSGGFSLLGSLSNLPSNEQKSGLLKTKKNVIEIGLEKKINKNLFTTLSGQRTDLDLGKLNSIYGSVNYQFVDTQMQPYLGFFLGYSKLDWDSRPFITPRFVEDLSSKSFMYGLQAGVEYGVTEDWTLLAKYQFVEYDHKLDIDRGAYHVTHDYAQNILVGVKYGF